MAMVLLCAGMLSACGRGDAASTPTRRSRSRAADVSLASVHADSPGIAWFDGDVDAAFASAQGV